MIAVLPTSIPRSAFESEHDLLRDAIRRFCEREIVPYHTDWEAAGSVPRELWKKAGAAGFLCMTMPEEYGGGGADFRSSAVLIEELARIGASGPGFSLVSDIVAPYVLHYGSEEQKRTWLPKFASGEAIAAIAMTEPGTGSDLAAITTRAERDGDEWVLTGAKTFVTNGAMADVVIVVASSEPGAGARGVSLFLVERSRPGFISGTHLKKLGMHAQDTAEFSLDRCRIPASALLGDVNRGFRMLMGELAQERLSISVGAVASAEASLAATVEYTRERQAFGKRVLDFQNTRFTLATLRAQIVMARVFVDRCIELLCAGELDAATAAMAKLETTELQFRTLDACLQLHGGYGYMQEYPIARAWADARVQRIYGGSNEIMREIIGRTLDV
jgi:alkylation response protein AidB-like acyl-CoA dehydrogenase